MSIESIREKISLAEHRVRNCLCKADAADRAGDHERADMYDDYAGAAEEELDELYRELSEAEDDGGARFLREYVADVAYGR